LTHLFGFLAALYFTGLLWRLARGDRRRQLGVGIFGLSMCLLYFASSTYHALLRPPSLINFFQRLDHSAIYILIPGTYTPIYMVLLPRPLRTRLLLLMWALAVVGIVCKWLLPMGAYELSVGLYVSMGWTGLLSAVALVRAIGWRATAFGVLGGVFYTIGGVCDAPKGPRVHPGARPPHQGLPRLPPVGTFLPLIL